MVHHVLKSDTNQSFACKIIQKRRFHLQPKIIENFSKEVFLFLVD